MRRYLRNTISGLVLAVAALTASTVEASKTQKKRHAKSEGAASETRYYDGFGNPQASIQRNGNTTRIYDGFGNPKAVIVRDGNTTRYYDGFGNPKGSSVSN